MTEAQKNDMERVNLLITILGRGNSDACIKELRRLGITFNMAALGTTKLGQEWAEMFGMSEKDCDVILSVVTQSKVRLALAMVEYRFSLNKPGNGFASIVPISGVGGPISLKYISGLAIEPEEEE
jgi:hypothetical protein